MNSSMLTTERFRYARRLTGLSRNELSEKHNINVHTVQSWESGKSNPSKRGAKSFCSALMAEGVLCTEDWLLYGQGEVPQMLTSQRYSPQANNWAMLMEIEAFKNLNPTGIVVLLRDDALEPYYQQGSYVGGIDRGKDYIERSLNQVCIVETSSGDTFVRKVLRGNMPNKFTLACINPLTSEISVMQNVTLNKVAEVIWYRKQYEN
jgi:transcriptional regulator with XRE-family HTH domain